MACELARLEIIPCIVRQMSRDEAIIIMVDSNLQREVILPSEKAKSYKMKIDAMRRQGQRLDLTCSPLDNKLYGKKSLAIIGESSGDSQATVHRYIRLNELIPQVLDLVDAGKIAMRPAVELSFLPTEQQETLFEAIESEGCTPSQVQAAKMRKFSEEGRLNEDVILSILQEQKPNQVDQFKMPREKISRFFPEGTPVQNIEETIIKALELWRKRERSRDAR
jgi:ParB family chromosome partitioning protein